MPLHTLFIAMSGCIGTPVNAPPETQPQHNCLTVVSAAFDPEARGSFPPARGASLALDVGIALADGLLYTLFPRGRTLPASTSVILTTAEDFQQWCEVNPHSVDDAVTPTHDLS